MLLNMVNAGSGAQIVKFTIDTTTDIHINYITVNGVKLASGKVTGFIVTQSSNVPYGDGSVIALFKEYTGNSATSGPADGVLYNSDDSKWQLYRTTSGEDYQYDDENQTFKFRCRQGLESGAYASVSAGDYTLVIW